MKSTVLFYTAVICTLTSISISLLTYVKLDEINSRLDKTSSNSKRAGHANQALGSNRHNSTSMHSESDPAVNGLIEQLKEQIKIEVNQIIAEIKAGGHPQVTATGADFGKKPAGDDASSHQSEILKIQDKMYSLDRKLQKISDARTLFKTSKEYSNALVLAMKDDLNLNDPVFKQVDQLIERHLNDPLQNERVEVMKWFNKEQEMLNSRYPDYKTMSSSQDYKDLQSNFSNKASAIRSKRKELENKTINALKTLLPDDDLTWKAFVQTLNSSIPNILPYQYP